MSEFYARAQGGRSEATRTDTSGSGRLGGQYEVVEDWVASDPRRGELKAGDCFVAEGGDIDFLSGGGLVVAKVRLLHDGERLPGDAAIRQIIAPPIDPPLRVRALPV